MQVTDGVKFSVANTGPGISPQHVDDVFLRGLRGQSRGMGLGIGLAIAKGIVAAHGGTIGVSSDQGKGAVFWFVLPSESAHPPKGVSAS